jgi:hypothetical protein
VTGFIFSWAVFTRLLIPAERLSETLRPSVRPSAGLLGKKLESGSTDFHEIFMKYFVLRGWIFMKISVSEGFTIFRQTLQLSSSG